MNQEQQGKTGAVSQKQSMATGTQREDIPAFPFPFADHSLECPAEYERMRQECPVAQVHMPRGGDAYLLTRYEDVFKTFADPNCRMIRPEDGNVPRREEGVTESFLSMESDTRHNKIRRLVTQVFSVRHANTLRPGVVELTNVLIDKIERSGPLADLFEDYAVKTPMAVICRLLGIPAEDEYLFRAWGRNRLSLNATAEEKRETERKMTEYLTPIIEREREQPGDTVIGLLVKAWGQGEEVLTLKELHLLARTLIVAGFETVSTTFTNSAFILLQRRELIAQLRERLDDPERMASAIEEILRITPILLGRARITRKEMSVSDMTVPSGEVVFLSTLSANRDEAVFPYPDEIDLDRSMKRPIMTFGRGIHVCIGQQIARMELQVLWTTLLKRLPEVRLAVPPSEIPWRSNETSTFGPAHLPVTW
ncbi:cytochrome P450 [Reticulibacter mediterranei]|uniref:Cytochrome P450 n=1 Tax=Reticulibacter mediterranei TaxID=2778369 RepID=A0A8J3MYQ5_9CHLR|nr:cytochrome P450 [Reticulibacter mediterranei]GHO92319.1 cytochrome P450 [Reticulibacter mediterranei]